MVTAPRDQGLCPGCAIGWSVVLHHQSPRCLGQETCLDTTDPFWPCARPSCIRNPWPDRRGAPCWHSWWNTLRFICTTTHAAVNSLSSPLRCCKLGAATLRSSEINLWWVTDSLVFPYLIAVTLLLKCNLNPSFLENKFLHQMSGLESFSPWASGLGDYATWPLTPGLVYSYQYL